jgi:hypothetical protein
MTCTKKGIVRWFAVWILVVVVSGSAPGAKADEGVLVYPSSAVVFNYDTTRYEVLGPADDKYNSSFAIGNQMLWDAVENRIPQEIYSAPGLVGFAPTVGPGSDFVTLHNEFKLIVDGFCAAPRLLSNLHVRFLPVPSNSNVVVELNGTPITSLTQRIDDFAVSTPTGDGYFADTREHHIRWSGAIGLRIVVFVDKNFNGVFDDGPPEFAIRADDNTIPVEKTSWGAVKALYGAD